MRLQSDVLKQWSWRIKGRAFRKSPATRSCMKNTFGNWSGVYCKKRLTQLYRHIPNKCHLVCVDEFGPNELCPIHSRMWASHRSVYQNKGRSQMVGIPHSEQVVSEAPFEDISISQAPYGYCNGFGLSIPWNNVIIYSLKTSHRIDVLNYCDGCEKTKSVLYGASWFNRIE